MPRTLPSSSTLGVLFALIFIAGAVLWIVGGRLARAARRAEPVPIAHPAPTVASWTDVVVDNGEPVDRATRIDMIERLAIVGEPWCVETLNAALRGDADPDVREAADRALLVIAARGL